MVSPVSFDERNPVTLSLVPEVVPVTITENVQVDAAAIEPPVSATVFVADVVVTVPPHPLLEPSTTSSPLGRTSVNESPDSAVLPDAVLSIVNVRVAVSPATIDGTENDLEIVADGGASAHPVSLMSSMRMFAPELSLRAPDARMRKTVVPEVFVRPVKSCV